MAAPASLLLPPTSAHSHSHSAAQQQQHQHLLRSPLLPDVHVLQGLDRSLHQHRHQLLASGSSPSGSPASIDLSSASPLLLASLNLAPSCRPSPAGAAPPCGLPQLPAASLPLPLGFSPYLSSSSQWQQAPALAPAPAPGSILGPPRTMSEALARWGGSAQLQYSSGQEAHFGQSLPFCSQGMKTNSQNDHHHGLNFFSSGAGAGAFPSANVSMRLAEELRNQGEELGSEILHPCSPSRGWEEALSASSQWPLNVEELDEAGNMQSQSLVDTSAADDLQLGDFCFHQWPLLELQDGEHGHDCGGGGGGGVSSSVLSSNVGSELGCKAGGPGYLSSASDHISSLEGFQSMGSPVTVLESCLMMESQSRSHSVADFAQLCSANETSDDRRSMEVGSDSKKLKDDGPELFGSDAQLSSQCDHVTLAASNSEQGQLQGQLQGQEHQQHAQAGSMLPVPGDGNLRQLPSAGMKRARAADCEVPSPGGPVKEACSEEPSPSSMSFGKLSSPPTKRRRSVQAQAGSPSPRPSRKSCSPAASSAAAASALVQRGPSASLREDCKGSPGSIPLPPGTPSPDIRPSGSAKNRVAGHAAVTVAEVPQRRGPLASNCSDKITTQVLRAVAGVEASSPAGLDVKPGLAGKRRRGSRGSGGDANSSPVTAEAGPGKQPAVKKARTSKASQAAARANAVAQAEPPRPVKHSPSSERESHVIAERRRRKSMNCMLSTLGSLLPADGVNPKPSDRLKIVAETISYIEGMQQSLKQLAQKKTELTVAQKLLRGSHNVFAAYKTKIYPSNRLVNSGSSTDLCKSSGPSSSSESQDHKDAGAGVQQWDNREVQEQQPFTPVFTLDICGGEAFITLTCLKGSLQLFSRTLLLLESLRFRVLNAQKSTNTRTAYHMIHITDVEEARIKKEDLQAALQNLVNNFQ